MIEESSSPSPMYDPVFDHGLIIDQFTIPFPSLSPVPEETDAELRCDSPFPSDLFSDHDPIHAVALPHNSNCNGGNVNEKYGGGAGVADGSLGDG